MSTLAMVNHKKLPKTLLGAVLLYSMTLWSHWVYANERESSDYQEAILIVPAWYLGAELGVAITDITAAELDSLYQDAGINAQSIELDKSDTFTSIYLGYQYHRYFAVELGYVDLGERSVDFIGKTTDLDNFTGHIEQIYPQSGKGISAALVAFWPISPKLLLSGKLGYWHWQGDYITQQNVSEIGSSTKQGNDLWFGVSLGYQFNKRSQLYINAQQFSLEEIKNNAYGVGIRYTF
ncbi:outer membrane beta-barrel protein [Litorilituus lipolyticus]|uniref:Outer membrane protein OmpA-like transmembrane domain-containing protein n=1 Tax=Litorilituus lipolyticus TaxID=2491017 RepID=A0A502KPJ4_9GAMM|nr:outer membrane beta-barrel protein [Litorilituus lipolyticus]TPH12125.1 hypothetical protein EPA86_17375 [Litorilituus lipolyticus]